MDIPESVDIGGHTIKVVRRTAIVDGEECWGTFNAKSLEITIDESIPDSLALETFWHEIVEALNVFAETDLAHHHIQVMGLLLGQVATSIEWSGGRKRNETLARAARKPSHKKRG